MWRKNDDFIANFLLNQKLKDLLKSTDIWQNYEGMISLVFFTHSVYTVKLRNTCAD